MALQSLEAAVENVSLEITSISQGNESDLLWRSIPHYYLTPKEIPQGYPFLRGIPVPQSWAAAQQLNAYFEQGHTITIDLKARRQGYEKRSPLKWINQELLFNKTFEDVRGIRLEGTVKVQNGPSLSIGMFYHEGLSLSHQEFAVGYLARLPDVREK